MPYEYVSDDKKAANALIGKRIDRVLVSENEDYLVFETDAGDVVWETYSDCCSETWFADITGVNALLGGRVASVECADLPSVEDGRTRQESDSFYGMKITTDKGNADIIYRNSSNGYYGGNASLAKERPSKPLREITDDWQA
jgi:hypothetical protein